MLVLSTKEEGRKRNTGHFGLLFDIEAGPQAILIHALWAESNWSRTSTVAIRTALGGWQANQAREQEWGEAGVGKIMGRGNQTRLALRQPLRVEAGQRLGIYLHTPDVGGGIGYHDGGDMSPVQGDGLVIHKGTATKSATPFERIQSVDRFFARRRWRHSTARTPPSRRRSGRLIECARTASRS